MIFKKVLIVLYFMLFAMNFTSAEGVYLIDCGELKLKTETVRLIAIRNESEESIVVFRSPDFLNYQYSKEQTSDLDDLSVIWSVRGRYHIQSENLTLIKKGDYYIYTLSSSILNAYQKDKLFLSGLRAQYSKAGDGGEPLKLSKKLHTKDLKLLNSNDESLLTKDIKGRVLICPTDTFNIVVGEYLKASFKEKIPVVDITIKVDETVIVFFHLIVNYQNRTVAVSLINNDPKILNSDKSEYNLDDDGILEFFKKIMENKKEFQKALNIQVLIIPCRPI